MVAPCRNEYIKELVYLNSSGGSLSLIKSHSSLSSSFPIGTMKELNQLISEVSSSAR